MIVRSPGPWASEGGPLKLRTCGNVCQSVLSLPASHFTQTTMIWVMDFMYMRIVPAGGHEPDRYAYIFIICFDGRAAGRFCAGLHMKKAADCGLGC